MDTKENIHAGHRDRLTEKLLKNADGLCDHEILEYLLFSVLPRVDTNPIAHRLLRTFGSLEKVFSATAKELQTVEGVGKKVAGQIVAIGKVINTVSKEKKGGDVYWDFPAKHVEELYVRFALLRQERFLLIFLDKDRKQTAEIVFDNSKEFEVSADVPEIANTMAIHKPKFAIVIHNHPSGNPSPSEMDDITTKKINVLCSMHGVCLCDHLIIGDKKYYSYHAEGRLDYIKEVSSLDTLLTK